MTSSEGKIAVEIRTPFLRIRTDDVLSLFPRRKHTAGPFLIISVSSGLALDTAFRHGAGERPHLWAPHGKPQQLWYLRPSGHVNEVLIVSALNGLVLDAGRGEGHRVQMRPEKDAAWQRWRLAPSADRMAHVLASVGTGTVLHCPSGAEQTTEPVMREPAERDNQQWLLLLPFGAPEK
ncbi:MAG TPA: RICIN domain-containing protein [Mycobacteriales bacterium]